MLDFANIENYRENNRIEAKKSLGGLPHSIWETYSAFANTMGGIILLGVEEYRDKSFHTVDLPDPDRLVSEFLELLNDPKKVSVNILSENDIKIHETDGKHIIAINVPRARRADKPVYIGGNPAGGTYRRNGEGDYKCTSEEIAAMMRDAALKTADMSVIERLEVSALDADSIKSYRLRVRKFEVLSDGELLVQIGAAKKVDGKLRPTAAGLLMFGRIGDITEEFPEFRLEYTGTGRSLEGKNLWDFYISVCDELLEINADAAVYGALCEALANCLVNADYNAGGGVAAVKGDTFVSFSNPGGFRIDVDAALSGGVSDPRNGALTKMFNLAKVGKGTGSGIPNIYRVWKNRGFSAPVFEESFDPDRVTLILELGSSEGTRHIGRQVTVYRRDVIADYLTVRITASSREVAELLGISASRARAILSEMIADGTVVPEGAGKKRVYKLKA